MSLTGYPEKSVERGYSTEEIETFMQSRFGYTEAEARQFALQFGQKEDIRHIPRKAGDTALLQKVEEYIGNAAVGHMTREERVPRELATKFYVGARERIEQQEGTPVTIEGLVAQMKSKMGTQAITYSHGGSS